MLLPYGQALPRVDAGAFIAPNAVLIGNVEIAAGANIWFNCVLRGDVNYIRVGAGTNLQDGTVVHVTRNKFGTEIGAGVTVGHMALIHGCRLEDNCFVGMSAAVMDGCVVESGAMLAAGALLTPGKRIPVGELWSGRPAKFMRRLSDADIAGFRETAEHYARLGAEYRETLRTDRSFGAAGR